MFDRLGRKSDETPFVVEWFTKKGVRVWSVQEGEQRFESHTDRLTNYIRFWQADGESQKTSMRTKTALGQMVEEGRFRGGNAPYGYRLEKSGILNKRKHEVYMLVIDEDEARVVRMMFDLCISSGYGRWRLANFLNDHGIKNRKGQNWHDASVGGILHNPLYKGILRSGETYAGPFEALQIIAPDQFDLAQKLMLERTNERKERRTVPLNTTGQSLLSGTSSAATVEAGWCSLPTGQPPALRMGRRSIKNVFAMYATIRPGAVRNVQDRLDTQCTFWTGSSLRCCIRSSTRCRELPTT